MTALDRLIDFRLSWNSDDVIDEDSGLTAADLDEVIKELQEMQPDPNA